MENTNIETYAFTWQEKCAAAAEATRPPRGTLHLCREESRDPDTTENIYIEGDNIDALKLLQEHYRGKVNFIYIDIFIPSLIQSHIAQKARNRMVQAVSDFLCFVASVLILSRTVDKFLTRERTFKWLRQWSHRTVDVSPSEEAHRLLNRSGGCSNSS